MAQDNTKDKFNPPSDTAPKGADALHKSHPRPKTAMNILEDLIEAKKRARMNEETASQPANIPEPSEG